MDQITIFDLVAIRFKDLLPGHTLVFGSDLAQRIAGPNGVKFFIRLSRKQTPKF
jgi:hypothetical protein